MPLFDFANGILSQSQQAIPALSNAVSSWWSPIASAMSQQMNRDPSYTYGNILPFRVANYAGASPQFGLGYSNLFKSAMDAFTAPGRALSGEQITPQDAVNFAINSVSPGVGGGLVRSGLLEASLPKGTTSTMMRRGWLALENQAQAWESIGRHDKAAELRNQAKSEFGAFAPKSVIGTDPFGEI